MPTDGEQIPFPSAAQRHHRALWEVERKLRECLNTLDTYGLSLTASHVDLALHHLYKDLSDLQSFDPAAPSSDRA